GEIEVDALAGHQPLAEWDDIGEGHGEGTLAGRDAKPLAAAGSAQRSPDSADIVTDGDALVLRSQIGERAEELLLVRCSDGVPAVASSPSGTVSRKQSVTNVSRMASMSRAASASRCASKRRTISLRSMVVLLPVGTSLARRCAEPNAVSWWSAAIRVPD